MENMADNVVVDEMVDTVETIDTSDNIDNTDKTTDETADSGNATTKDETKAFSERLNKAKVQWENETTSKIFKDLNMVNSFTNKPITNMEEYLEFQRMQEVANKGDDPVAVSELEKYKSELMTYKQKEADENMKNDPNIGKIYSDMRDDVMTLVDLAKNQGQEITIENAFSSVLKENLPSIIKKIKTQADKEALQKLTETNNSTPGSLNTEIQQDNISYNDMNKSDFDKILKKALSGELKKE